MLKVDFIPLLKALLRSLCTRFLGLLLIGLGCGLSSSVYAQLDFISLEAKVFSGAVRPGGPLKVEVTLTSKSPGLIEGDLVFEIEEVRGVQRIKIPKSTIVSGEQSHQLLFSPIQPRSLEPLLLKAKIIVKDTTIELGEQNLIPSVFSGHPFIMGVGGDGDTLRQYATLLEELKVEKHYEDAILNQTPNFEKVQTFPLAVSPLPTDPALYCDLDTLILFEEYLPGINSGQWEALIKWLKSGGSLAISHGEPSEKIKGFIQGLHDEADFVTPGEFQHGRVGLGNFVLVKSWPEGDDFRSDEWERLVGFLWNVKLIHRDNSRAVDAQWAKPIDPKKSVDYELWKRRHETLSAPVNTTQDDPYKPLHWVLPELLTPKNLSFIPPKTILYFLITLFILLVPIDYFFLGIIKKRHWTWILTLILSVSGTVYALNLADTNLGQHSSKRTLSIVDLGKRGQVLRENQFDLVFPQEEKEFKITLKEQLFSAMTFDIDEESPWSLYKGGINNETTVTLPPLTGERVLTRDLIHWRPELHRNYFYNKESPSGQTEWDSFWNADESKLLNLPELHERVKELYKVEEVTLISINGITEIQSQGRDGDTPLGRLLIRLTVPEWLSPLGAFRSVSPAGGMRLDDLSIIDTSDPQQWALIVLLRVGDSYQVYRRLYGKESS